MQTTLVKFTQTNRVTTIEFRLQLLLLLLVAVLFLLLLFLFVFDHVCAKLNTVEQQRCVSVYQYLYLRRTGRAFQYATFIINSMALIRILCRTHLKLITEHRNWMMERAKEKKNTRMT